VAVFTAALDLANLNTIGKQNYQEPGVEAELNFEFFWVLPFYIVNNDMGTEALRLRP